MSFVSLSLRVCHRKLFSFFFCCQNKSNCFDHYAWDWLRKREKNRKWKIKWIAGMILCRENLFVFSFISASSKLIFFFVFYSFVQHFIDASLFIALLNVSSHLKHLLIFHVLYTHCSSDEQKLCMFCCERLHMEMRRK